MGPELPLKILLSGFFADLHVLIEDIPGTGKTTLARTLSKATGMDFARIQFTPDLIPGDIIGMSVWSREKREFVFKPGAVMHQFLLTDEINRASAQTQASLLEAMQESSVTVEGITHSLPDPFFVLATQNPVTFQGTFSLPEAQLDRFGISLSLGYPNPQHELTILNRFKTENPLSQIEAVLLPEDVIQARKDVREIKVDTKIQKYIIQIAGSTRRHGDIRLGMSPRATQHLMQAAQGMAFVSGRNYVIPEDVRDIAPHVLGHRIIFSPQITIQQKNEQTMLQEIINSVSIPAGL